MERGKRLAGPTALCVAGALAATARTLDVTAYGAKPANVARIYFDNALLTFDGYTPPAKVGLGQWETTAPAGGWRDDPRMPVNRAGEIAKAGIKVLLVYGTSDIAVKPTSNSKAFLSKFKAAGGAATVLEHSEYGHHPHGVEPGEAKTVMQFFIGEGEK